MVTIFKDVYSAEPVHIELDVALSRIKTGVKSKELVGRVRAQIDKEKANAIKLGLPCVCFSGKFPPERTDASIIEHSGFIALDWDEVGKDFVRDKQTEVINHDFIYACWISPRANGLKALVRIADGKKHRQHFAALQEIFPDLDDSGVNESRVCFESYDPDIYINKNAKVFTKIKKTEQVEKYEVETEYENIFNNILVWLANKGDAFLTGERNLFLYKLASACCRFGIPQEKTFHLFDNQFDKGSDFTVRETQKTIASAYRSKKNVFGSAAFERETLVDKITRTEVKIDADIYDKSIRPKDVIYGIDVKQDALKIFEHGYEQVDGIDCELLDDLYKMRRGEITLLSGVGNFGKSQYLKWFLLLHAVLYGRKFALFSPEDNPPGVFYHDFTEMLLGDDCTLRNPYRPEKEIFEKAYDFISEHFFYIYPESVAPTPDYIKERFLELIVKENIDGCIIDPFNQMSNDYKNANNRDDRYLEAVLGEFDRFAVMNNVFFWIVAHPKVLTDKDARGNYKCPTVFELAGGAMWNNKMYNILIYHRPFNLQEPNHPACEIHTKKIKRQKIVGKKGTANFEYERKRRRYFVDDVDIVQKALDKKSIKFF